MDLQYQNQKRNVYMNNLFIDLGTHMGSGLLDFIKRYSMTEGEWEIHTFEPQPRLFELASSGTTERFIGYPYSFSDMNEALKLFPRVNRHNVAASDKDGEADFFIEQALSEMHMGSTLVSDVPNRNDRLFSGEFIKVKTVNIYEFIKNKITNNLKNLIIKIDIESAEFLVLNKFIQGFQTDGRFNAENIEIYCEFHHRCLPNDPSKYPSVEYYRNRMKEFGVILHEWH